MNVTSTTRVAIDALIGFIITFATSVLSLLSQGGVSNLSEISQSAYVASFLGAILATAKLVQSRLSDSPANISQTNDIVKAAANLDDVAKDQRGFALGAFIVWVLAGTMMVLALSSMHGCSVLTKPSSVQDSIATGYTLVASTAKAVAEAKTAGLITAAQRDSMVVQLQTAKDALDVAAQVLPSSVATAADKAAVARAIINSLIIELQKIQPTKVGMLT
jgi:hypothetical protein